MFKMQRYSLLSVLAPKCNMVSVLTDEQTGQSCDCMFIDKNLFR